MSLKLNNIVTLPITTTSIYLQCPQDRFRMTENLYRQHISSSYVRSVHQSQAQTVLPFYMTSVALSLLLFFYNGCYLTSENGTDNAAVTTRSSRRLLRHGWCFCLLGTQLVVLVILNVKNENQMQKCETFLSTFKTKSIVMNRITNYSPLCTCYLMLCVRTFHTDWRKCTFKAHFPFNLQALHAVLQSKYVIFYRTHNICHSNSNNKAVFMCPLKGMSTVWTASISCCGVAFLPVAITGRVKWRIFIAGQGIMAPMLKLCLVGSGQS